MSTTLFEQPRVAESIQSPAVRIWQTFAGSRMAILALAVLLVIVLAALLAPWITPQNPYDLTQLDFRDGRMPPGAQASSQLYTHWLGTDDQGRDMLSAILYGLRTSLGIGFGSAVLAAVLGTLLGLVAAYREGWVDATVMRLVDLHLSFPSILVALMILAAAGGGLMNVVLAIVVVEWAYYARTARATALAERRKEYVEAAQGLGVSGWRIMWRHLLPNCVAPLIVILSLQVARAIALEATLSFLGVGVPVTSPSLGLLIANGFQYVLSGDYWISFYPGIALMVVIVAVNLIGDRLRDAINPRHQS